MSKCRRAAVGCLAIASAASHAATGGDLHARIAAFVGPGATPALDARLKTATCAETPTIDWYGVLGRAVVVTCTARPGWRFFVPVKSAQAAQQTAGYVAPVIKRGDLVMIHAGGAGFSITAEGVAEQDGRPGAHIRVRNSGTGGTLKAVVQSEGNVSLPGYKSGSTGR